MEKTAWEDLTISNDFLFSKLMRDPEICKEIIEVLLEIEIEKIVYIEEEKTIKIGYDAKNVRLEILFRPTQITPLICVERTILSAN